MAQDLTIHDGPSGRAQLPAHLQAAYADQESNIITGERGASLSVRGSKFHVTIEGVTQTLMRRDEDGNEIAIGALPVVVLDYAPLLGRTYFEGEYDQTSTTSPTCWSFDSIAPEDDVPEKQALKCAQCPMAQKGSKVSDNGKSMTACAQHRVVVVVPAKGMDSVPPLRIRLPQTSNYDGRSPELRQKGLFAFQNYLESLKLRGIPNTRAIVTTMSFDPNVSHPKVLFRATSYVSEEQHAQIERIMQSGQVEEILGRTGTVALQRGTNERPLPKPESQVVKGKSSEVDARFAGAEASLGTRQAEVIPPKQQAKANDKPKASMVIDHEPEPQRAAAAAPVPGNFVSPPQNPGEDEDDYADRVTAARRAWKAAVLEQAERAKAPAASATFTPPAQKDGEDEDDYADRVTAARRAWKAAQAAPAAPAVFEAPEQEPGEDEDDYADRVTAARRAFKAAHGGAANPVKAAEAAEVQQRKAAQTSAAGAAPQTATRTRRTKAQIEADNAAKAQVGAAPQGGALGTLGADADDEGTTIETPAAPAKGGAKGGAKGPIEAQPTAVPDNVAAMLSKWE